MSVIFPAYRTDPFEIRFPLQLSIYTNWHITTGSMYPAQTFVATYRTVSCCNGLPTQVAIFSSKVVHTVDAGEFVEKIPFVVFNSILVLT